MARKKTGKLAAGRGQSATMLRMDKDFRAAPNLLSAQISKEIKALKIKDNKLKTNSNKLKAKVKSSEQRFKKATKTKNTSSGKKQFLAAKKLHSNNLKSQTILEKQLKENSGLLEAATQRQAKYAALKKHLSQFEKDWAKKTKKTKAKSTGASTKTKKRTQKPTTFDRTQSERQPQDNFQRMDEDIRVDETTEVTS